MTRTKIVCTIGPACQDEETLEKLINAGMDVARLNFSHGDHESHRKLFDSIRNLSLKLKKPVAILQDLCGPKIRLGKVTGETLCLEMGQKVSLTSIDEDTADGSDGRFHVSYPHLSEDLKPGEPVLIDDGLVQMEVDEISGKNVICRVTVPGNVSSHKGVNLPGSSLRIPALTEKDEEDLLFGMELGVDFVALSFVRRAGDIEKLKRFMEERGASIPVIAKIEKQEAVANLDEILNVASGAMVARGDLGVEVPIERMPMIQKRIIRKCNSLSKPVITATQMLDSMIRNPLPTRAEVTDVANAIIDGTDAVMLSGETASGKYPVRAVETMDRVAREAENNMASQALGRASSKKNVVDSVSLATCQIAEELEAKAIMVLTDSGRTARLVSRYKPRQPVVAITYNEDSVRRLQLSWGVFPLLVEQTPNTDKMFENANNAVLQSGIVNAGDLVVTTAGIPAMVKGSTNMVKVDVLGKVFLRGTAVGRKARITGKAFVCDNPEKTACQIEEGDILITRRVDERFLSIAHRLGGLVAEEGTAGSYGDFFCEKFQIPGILGIPGLMKAFFNGRIVTIDGERGIVFGEST